MSSAIAQGRRAVAALDPKLPLQWLGKILFGLLYRQTLLLADRSNPASGTIVDPVSFDELRTHRLFLQQVRGQIVLKDFVPGSLFVFETQINQDSRRNWDIIDFIPGLVVAVRAGNVGLIAALGDGGAQTAFESFYSKYYKLALHPIQFRELFARVAYYSTLATRTPKYITMSSKGRPAETYQLPLMGLSSKPLFAIGKTEDYAHFLSGATGRPIEAIYKAPGSVHRFLKARPKGKPLFIDWKSYPW